MATYATTLDDLEALLALLRREGVTSFASGDLKVELLPQAGVKTIEASGDKVFPEEPHTGYHHPSLWPSGKPPTFPGKL